MERFQFIPDRTRALLLMCAAALLLTVGFGVWQGAKAALTYFSEEYEAGIEQTHIEVELTEQSADETGPRIVDQDRPLLTKLLPAGEAIMATGRPYVEKLSVQNASDLPEYVRLTVRKYWTDTDGNKMPGLDPSLIALTWDDPDSMAHWVYSEEESTDERLVFYYRYILPGYAQAAAPAVTEIAVSDAILVPDYSVLDGNGKPTMVVAEKYRDCRVALSAQVDSVQYERADDAAGSAWGVDTKALGLVWDGTVPGSNDENEEVR